MSNLPWTRRRVIKKIVGSGNSQRERQIVPVPEDFTTARQVMDYFGCSRTTAVKTLRRGYYIFDYMHRVTFPGTMDPEVAYKIAWKIFHQRFKGRTLWVEVEDVIQEGVAALIEMAGHPRFGEINYRFSVAQSAMRNFLKRQQRRREHEEAHEDPNVRVSGKPDTWQRKTKTEDIMLALIEHRAA